VRDFALGIFRAILVAFVVSFYHVLFYVLDFNAQCQMGSNRFVANENGKTEPH
jgi:hypothetical protein